MDHGVAEAVIPPPRVYRVARRGGDPFAPPPWDRAGLDGTFGNRFDDPSAERGLTSDQRFRTVYCATTAEGAFGETVARFRPSITLLERLQDIEAADWLVASTGARREPVAVEGGVVPADWRLRRLLARTQLEPTLHFADFAAPQTHQLLRRVLASTIAALGLYDLDFSAIIGPHRVLTQRCARVIYDLCDADGTPVFAGIRYLSRLNAEWECWAIFADRLVHTSESLTAIASDNPDLLAASKVFSLGIEAHEDQPVELRER